LQKTHCKKRTSALSAIALFANPLMAYFRNFVIFVDLLQGLKTECFFYVPKMLFPSQNSADTSSTSQDSYCTAETKKNSAEGKDLVRC